MCGGAGNGGRLKLDRLLEVEAGVGEQVDLVVHVHVDRRVLVDCLQVRGAVETADVGTWEKSMGRREKGPKWLEMGRRELIRIYKLVWE